jgi:hypothetical protein
VWRDPVGFMEQPDGDTAEQGGDAMRNAKFLTILIGRLAGALGVGLVLAFPVPATAAAIAPAMQHGAEWASGEAPPAYSLTPAAPGAIRIHKIHHQAPPPRQFRLFGYPSANADELPPRVSVPAAPALLFAHATLGVAMLDTPQAGGDRVADAGGGQLSPAQLDLTVPAERTPLLPSPLPIALLVALVLLPAALVLGQALHGPSRRPRPAMRRRPVARRSSDD